jgi:hypothetical protein
VVLLASFGCGSKEKSFIGSWKGTAKLDTNAKSNEMAAAMGKAFAGSMTLDLNADHTFKMNALVAMEGAWVYSDDKITLHLTRAMGQDISHFSQSGADGVTTKVMDVSSDGKTLTPEDHGEFPAMVFTKN